MLSTRRTAEAIASAGLRVTVVAWVIEASPLLAATDRRHRDEVEQLSDAYHLEVGDQEAIVSYILEIRHADARERLVEPWAASA